MVRRVIGVMLFLGVASPLPAQQSDRTEFRVVPSLGIGPVLERARWVSLSGNALLEAEVERSGLLASAYVESFVVGAACFDTCDLTSTHIGLTGSFRRQGLLLGGGFGFGLDSGPEVAFARAGIEPGPFRIQLRVEKPLGEEHLVLPLMFGVRLPW